MSEFKFSICAISLAFSALFIGISLGLHFKPIWFGSFGALIVLFGVVSEYALLQKELSALYLALKGQGAAEAGNTGIPDLSPKNTHLRLARLSHVVIVMGTIIWGFGEQFLLWLLCKT